MSIATCPSPTALHGLIDGSLPESQQVALTEHVGHCSGCQRALEEQAAGSLAKAGLGLHHDTPPPKSAYWPALEKIAAGSTEPATTELPTLDDALEFLEPPTDPDSLGRLGKFNIVAVVGRGGMGLVLKAIDAQLHRTVAIKVLDPKLARNAVARQRFSREATAAAAVSHENIVVIHGVEESNGVPMLVMQYVAGISLQEHIDRFGALPPDDMIRLGWQMARGLAAAHEHGLIHRDIKPGNMLLENGIERVRITDFGLARCNEDVKLTQTGFVAGTPLYMSPEQARGEPLDHRADLFSLGSVMYAALAGRSPFDGSTPFLVLQQVTQSAPKPLRQINPDIPEALEAIVERLMAKKPDDRFQSAGEVAVLMKSMLLARCGGATPPNAASLRAVRPWRRRAASGVTVAAGIALATCLALGSLVASEAVGVTRFRQPVGRWLLAAGPTAAVPADATIEPLKTLSGNAGPIWSVAFSRGGSQVAMAVDDGTVRIWDTAKMKIVATLEGQHQGPVWSVAFDPDHNTVASAGDDGKIVLWDATTQKPRKVFRLASGVRSIAFAPKGGKLAAGGRDGTLSVWNPNAAGDKPELERLQAHAGVIMAVAWHGTTLVTAAGDKLARTWDAATLQPQVTLQGHNAGVYAVAVSPDGKTIATGSWDKTVKLWDADLGQCTATWTGHQQDVWSVAFSPCGGHLASASEDRTVRFWDLHAGREEMALHSASAVYAVSFSDDAGMVATGGRDGAVKLWEVATLCRGK